MEKLIISVPDKKSQLVRQILKELGVKIQPENDKNPSSYKQKILKVSTWTDDDLKVVKDSKKAFENLTPPQW